MADATSQSDLTPARVIATVIAAMVAMHSLLALQDPAPDAPHVLWVLAPAVLALAAAALVWRPRVRGLPIVALLFAAGVIQLFVVFGDSTFSRIMAGAMLAVYAAAFLWGYFVLPVLLWRRGAWPIDPIPFEPFQDDAKLPEPVQKRVRALSALGFMPRLMCARSDDSAAGTLVAMLHPERDALAMITHIVLGRHIFISTRLSPVPSETSPRLSIIDDRAPAQFPTPPISRVLLFPGAAARTLLAHFVRLHPHAAVAPPLSDAELMAAIEKSAARYERWLVDAGYLASEVTGEERKFTLKGGFSAGLRVLWPWDAIERARAIRDGRDALRDASGAGA